jgi:hypothetical protein
MQRRVMTAWMWGVTAGTGAFLLAMPPARGVNPRPLQSAYWRLEEGLADSKVPAAAVGNEKDGEVQNSVQDSINANHLQAYNTQTAPKYIDYTLPPTYLRDFAHNALAWEVLGQNGFGQDAYTVGKDINFGIVGTTVAPDVTGFTLEAAFQVFDYTYTRSIVGKEGRPGLKQGFGDPDLPTMGLKVRGSQAADPDAGKLQIELFDGAGNLVDVKSQNALATGAWYYAAVVNDGSTLSLYLDSNDGNGYVLQGQAFVDGALFQGTDPTNEGWAQNWTIGRVARGGASDNLIGLPADFFNGLIDEVRLTNAPLTPDQFLFTQTLIGDFNSNHRWEGGDFLAWQRGFGNPYDGAHLTDWKTRFGDAPAAKAVATSVPEPAVLALACAASAGAAACVRRRRPP